jgi:hypothetical protein
VSLRHRHEYAADFPMASTGSRVKPPAKFPAHIGGYAPHPAQIHQVRAGEGLRDVTTPVPRVLLSVTLAGPAPSGSTGTPRLLSGLLPPSPAPPGSGCP